MRSEVWAFHMQTGGCKSASAAVSGAGVYGRLKFEAGIHRVQRVPATEKSGRLHTSAASVAVLPQAEEVWQLTFHYNLNIDTLQRGSMMLIIRHISARDICCDK